MNEDVSPIQKMVTFQSTYAQKASQVPPGGDWCGSRRSHRGGQRPGMVDTCWYLLMVLKSGKLTSWGCFFWNLPFIYKFFVFVLAPSKRWLGLALGFLVAINSSWHETSRHFHSERWWFSMLIWWIFGICGWLHGRIFRIGMGFFLSTAKAFCRKKGASKNGEFRGTHDVFSSFFCVTQKSLL